MNFRPRTIAVAAVLTLAAGNAFAWETRVLTLGDQNRFVEDSANIWLYPQRTVRHTDTVLLDLNHFWDGDTSAFSEEDRAPFTLHAFSGDENHAVAAAEHTDAAAATQDAGILSTVGGGLNWSVTPDWTVGFWTTDYEDPTSLQLLGMAAGLQTSTSGPDWSQYVSDVGQVYPGDVSGAVNDAILHDRGNPMAGLGAKPDDAARKLDLFTAFRISPTFDLGFRLGFGSTTLFHFDSNGGAGYTEDLDGAVRDNDPQGQAQYTSSHFTLGTGGSLTFAKDAILDVGLTYEMRQWDFTADENVYQTVDPINSIDLNSRFRFRFSRNWWLIPSLHLHSTTFHTLIDTSFGSGAALPTDKGINASHITDVDISRLNFDLGLGSQMRVLDVVDVYAAFGFDYDKLQGDSTAQQGANTLTLEMFQLPYVRVGAEAPLLDWLKFRIGFKKNVAWIKQFEQYDSFAFNQVPHERAIQEVRDREYTVAPSTGGKSYFAFLGATAEVRGWEFEIQVDPELLYGNPFTKDPWFNRVTIAHEF